MPGQCESTHETAPLTVPPESVIRIALASVRTAESIKISNNSQTLSGFTVPACKLQLYCGAFPALLRHRGANHHPPTITERVKNFLETVITPKNCFPLWLPLLSG